MHEDEHPIRDRRGAWLARPRSGRPAALAMGVVLFGSAAALADDFDDANKKLFELDGRVRQIAAEFRDNQAAQSDPLVADRRVIAAQTLFELKNYDEAAIMLLDVIEKYPNSRAFDDAVLLLGEARFLGKDLNSARRYFEQAITKETGSRAEQRALQRLVEIALRTDDYGNVDGYLGRLDKVPQQKLEASVPYVRGKYSYFRGKLDVALASFGGIAPTSPYYMQARYFIATISVKQGEMADAATAFDMVLRIQARSDDEKEIQDLAHMAIGRVYFDRGQFDKARDAYAAVPRDSKYFTESMYESAWNAIKAKDFKSAYRALDLLLLQDANGSQAPELRLLMGNLNLRLGNFFVANGNFSEMRDQFEPLLKQVGEQKVRSQSDAKYFENLIGKNLDKFNIAAFVPPAAAKWIKPDVEMERMLALVEEVSEIKRDMRASEQLMDRLDRAVTGVGRSGLFSDLSNARTDSVEILNQTMDIRGRFAGRLRGLVASHLSAEEKLAIDRIASERALLEQQTQALPMSAAALKERDRNVRGAVTGFDAQASELNVLIRSLEAELIAIEQYYVTSRAEQKIRPEDLQGPVADLRTEIAVAQTALEKVRREIEVTAQEAATSGSDPGERRATLRLSDLMKAELEELAKVQPRLPSGARGEFDAVASVLRRADVVQTQLAEFDGRIDAAADQRLVSVKERMVIEQAQLQQATARLGGLMSESQSLGGGLASAMLTKVSDRFYELVVQSDVGLIDVSWGLKDQKTSAVSKLINMQKLELKSIEDDFKSLLEEDQK